MHSSCRPPLLGVAFVVPVGGVLLVVLIAAFPVRDSLSVLIQVIDLAAFCAPLAVIIQRADGEQDMYVCNLQNKSVTAGTIKFCR